MSSGIKGRLAENIIGFARALRRAGAPAGPARVLDAVRSIKIVGVAQKSDFFFALRACLVSKPEHLAVFEQVFRIYWRDPTALSQLFEVLQPSVDSAREQPKPRAAERRAAEAMARPDSNDTPEQNLREVNATVTFSASERLRSQDFEQMSAQDIADAKKAIERIKLPLQPLASRRLRVCSRGDRADWRGTMREALRKGGEISHLSMRAPVQRWPNLVALCDISGSMTVYSRMILHFLHAATKAKGVGWAHVHSFTFGTRLTNVTRPLRMKDVDDAIATVGRESPDWRGGTRIGESLLAFNRDWSRRVLGQGAVVLLITDGLDRGDTQLLAKQAERLKLSSRKLIWLNPLLRWDGFEAKAAGARALLPHVDSFRASHNLVSLAALADALTQSADTGEKQRLLRRGASSSARALF